MAGRKAEQAVSYAAVPAVSWLLRHYLGWIWWQALLVALPCAVIAGLIARGLKDTWPLDVEPVLADSVQSCLDAGWRLARIHPWWDCAADGTGKLPHAHLVHANGRKILLAYRQGKIMARPVS